MSGAINVTYYNSIVIFFFSWEFLGFENIFQIWNRPTTKDPWMLPYNVAIILDWIKVKLVLKITELLEVTEADRNLVKESRNCLKKKTGVAL